MKWPSSSAPAARNSARTSSSVIIFPALGKRRRQIGNRRPGIKRSAVQARATCLRDANPLPIRRARSAPGRPNPAARRAGPRGLDEDYFQARRHRRRLRPGARAAYAAAPRRRRRPPPTAAAPAGDAAAQCRRRRAGPALPRTAPTPGIGQPDGRYGLQDQVSPIGAEALWFHDIILMPLITVISLFVLALLAWVMFRYRRGANPTPSRNTHNTMLEVVWTLVPVLILVVIAVPSIRLLAHQYYPPARRSDGQGDRQPMVLGISISRPWRESGLEHAARRRGRRARRAAAARRRRADGGAGRRGGEDDRHLQRRHPRLGRSRLLDQDRRGSGPAQRDLVPGRPARASITASATNCAAPATATCRSRSRSSPASAVRGLGRRRSGRPSCPARRPRRGGTGRGDSTATGNAVAAPRRRPPPTKARPTD